MTQIGKNKLAILCLYLQCLDNNKLTISYY
jgi:hypothetical protein